MDNLLLRRRAIAPKEYSLSGAMPLSFNARRMPLKSLVRDGKCEQASTPTPTSPVDIWCNNGVLRWDSVNERIYADGTSESLVVEGKNLFTTTGCTLDKYIDTSGVEQSGIYNSYKFAHTALLPCKPNTKYTFSAKNVNYDNRSNHRIMGWTSNGTFIQQEANLEIPAKTTVGTRKSITFTTGANTHFLTINYIYDPDGELPQLELGETATSYEPYVTPQTASVADLLYFNASYIDTHDLISGVVNHKVGVKIFDGTERFYINTGTYASFQYTLSGKAATGNIAGFKCSHYRAESNWAQVYYGKVNNAFYFTNTAVCFTDGRYTNVDDFTAFIKSQYAAGTPVIVVYPLATPTTESVTPQSLSTAAGGNTISSTANVQSPQATVKYFK